MADWTGTLTFTNDKARDLESFIHEPDTRRGDIFAQGSLPLESGKVLDWIIKHDLFEGVVIHLSLMDNQGHTFLGGAESTLSNAGALFQTYSLQYDNQHYLLTVAKAG